MHILRLLAYFLEMMTMSGGFRCKECDLVFDTKKSYNAHVIFAHKTTSPSIKKILILGGGFSGLNVLRQIQKFHKE